MMRLDPNTQLAGPEDGVDGWQIREERGPSRRVSITLLSRTRVLEQWKNGSIKWVEHARA